MPTVYQILRMDELGTPPVMNGAYGPYEFNDPAEAARAAKIFAKNMGVKLCVKPVINAEWKVREGYRFINGTYRTLPWAGRPWWLSDQAYAIHKDHFAHASLEKLGWISYTKSEEDGTKDKQSLLRPGAYLSKYFEPVLSAYGLRADRLIDEFMAIYGEIDVKFAETEADIIRVYNNGPQTCIHGGKDYPKGIHPASVYAAGDLQVAYLGKIDGRISARTVVWPERKLHSRVYGDIARITQGLERLGYKWGAPIGARLKRIQLKPAKFQDGNQLTGCFLIPYLDKQNQAGGGYLSVIDKGDHLIIGHKNDPGSHHAGGADGYSGIYVPRDDEHPVFECEKCENQVRKVYQIHTEEPDDGDEGNVESWCEHCTNEFSMHCGYSGNWYSHDVRMIKVSGLPWCRYYAEMYSMKCEGNGKLYNKRELVHVTYPDGSTKWLSQDYYAAQGGVFVSDLTSRIFFNKEKTTVRDQLHRYSCSLSELRNRGFNCDRCNDNWIIEYRQQEGDNLFCPKCLPDQASLKLKTMSFAEQYRQMNLQEQQQHVQYNNAFQQVRFR